MSTPTILASQLSDLTTKLMIYYWTPIYIIGMLGNLINIIIFLRRHLRSNTCSQYFVGISIAQIVLLNSFCITRIVAYTTGYDLLNTVIALCKIRLYLFAASIGLMRQFLCLIAIDRWIVTTQVARIRQFSSSRVVRWFIIGSISFWIIYSIHVPIGYQMSQRLGCITPSGYDYAFFYAIQLIVSSILPVIIMILFSMLTFYNVRSRRRRTQIAPQNFDTVTQPAAIVFQNINYRRREMQLIKLSLLQVIFYVLLCMTSTCFPLYSVLTSSQKKSSDQNAIDLFIANIALTLLYTYTSLTFVLYTLASKTFRKELHDAYIQAFKYIKRCFSAN